MAKLKILVIEDERKLARFIKQGLEQQGHVADPAEYVGSFLPQHTSCSRYL